MDEIKKAIADELADVMKYMNMAKDCKHGSVLEDIAAEEMQHAKNLQTILGEQIMPEQWRMAREALHGAELGDT